MKKIILIIFILLLYGCSDYTEINDLAVVTGISIDYKDEEFNVSVQIILDSKESKIGVYSAKSKTIEGSLAEISKLCNKELFFSNLKVLIVSNNLLKNNINYYDYFLRESESKMNYYVYVVDDEIYNDLLNVNNDKEGSSLYLEKLMKFNERVFSSSTPLNFAKLLQNLLEYGINPVYPSITIKDNNGENVLYLDKLITFNNDNKMTELNDNEAIIYNILTNNTNTTVINVNCNNDDYFALILEDVSTSYDFKNKTFTYNIEATSKINTYHCDYKLTDDETIPKLEKLAQKYINNEANNLLELVKKNENDFLGIGNYIYKHNTKFFDFKNKDWDKYIKNIDVKVKSNIKIVSTGEAKKSLGDKYGKNK